MTEQETATVELRIETEDIDRLKQGEEVDARISLSASLPDSTEDVDADAENEDSEGQEQADAEDPEERLPENLPIKLRALYDIYRRPNQKARSRQVARRLLDEKNPDNQDVRAISARLSELKDDGYLTATRVGDGFVWSLTDDGDEKIVETVKVDAEGNLEIDAPEGQVQSEFGDFPDGDADNGRAKPSMTKKRYHILKVLQEADNPLTTQQIIQRSDGIIDKDSSRLSRMKKKKLIAGFSDPEDGRRYVWHVAARGANLYDELSNRYGDDEQRGNGDAEESV